MLKVFRYLGTISIGTLYRRVKAYEKHETPESLLPQYKYSKLGERKLSQSLRDHTYN